MDATFMSSQQHECDIHVVPGPSVRRLQSGLRHLGQEPAASARARRLRSGLSLCLPSAPLDISTMLGIVSGERNQEAYTMASTPTRDLPEEFLAATRKSQETMIRAIRTWVETVRTVTPKLPSVPGPLADRLPKLPSVTAPFTDRLPTPEDEIGRAHDFAEQL